MTDITAQEPSQAAIDEVNRRFAPLGIRVHPPEPSEGGGWQVRIATADGLVDFVHAPSAGQAWASAMAWVGP